MAAVSPWRQPGWSSSGSWMPCKPQAPSAEQDDCRSSADEASTVASSIEVAETSNIC